MSIELTLLLGFLFHLLGDYVFQNNWMAVNKSKKFLPAFIHVCIYSLPFLFLIDFGLSWVVIIVSHYFIDRYRLAVRWIQLVNVRLEKWDLDGYSDWDWVFNSRDNFGFPKETPFVISFWVMVAVDNTIHLVINTISILLFFKFQYIL